MTTHKFLASGARGPISGLRPARARTTAPRAWVGVDGPLALCARGVHVCRPLDLCPHWIHDELWQVETEGNAIERSVPHRGGASARSVRPVAAARTTRASVGSPARRARGSRARARRERQRPRAARRRAVRCTARLRRARFATVVVSRSDGERDAAYRREQQWQSAWLAREILALSSGETAINAIAQQPAGDAHSSIGTADHGDARRLSPATID